MLILVTSFDTSLNLIFGHAHPEHGTRNTELIQCFLAIMKDTYKTLPWPKNSPEYRGGKVLKQSTRP